MIPEHLKNIALEIEAAAKVRQNNQSKILAYCQDKSFDLNERFTYWSKYCNKRESGWVLHKNDLTSFLLGYIIEMANKNCERRDQIDYDLLIDYISEFTIDELDDLPEIKRELIIDSILENKTLNFDDDSKDWDIISDKLVLKLKEDILQENFGSYTFDW